MRQRSAGNLPSKVSSGLLHFAVDVIPELRVFPFTSARNPYPHQRCFKRRSDPQGRDYTRSRGKSNRRASWTRLCFDARFWRILLAISHKVSLAPDSRSGAFLSSAQSADQHCATMSLYWVPTVAAMPPVVCIPPPVASACSTALCPSSSAFSSLGFACLGCP